MPATIEALSPKLKNGEISPVELVEEYLQQIGALNVESNIFITICEKEAREQALKAEKELSKGLYRGPLHGIPYTCKDLFKTAGIRTTGGSLVLADNIPSEDADLIKQLKKQGAILLGKVNLHEFAFGITGVNPHYGTVMNPYAADRLAGGSSSGSAAAVARGIGLFSLGTDTGGSVRVPASLCGVYGFKPTYKLLSCQGIIPYCWSLDHAGFFTKSAADTRIVFSTLNGEQEKNEGSNISLKKLRIGYYPAMLDFTEPEIANSINDIIDHINSLGVKVIEVSMPDLKTSRTVSLILQLTECLSYHSRYLPEKEHLYGSDIKAGMTAGQLILAEHYVRAKRIIKLYKQEMNELFKTVDLIITPTTPCVAPERNISRINLNHQEMAVGNALTMFTSFFCMTGNPALSIPCGKSTLGLPYGAQIIGRPYEESLIVNTALALEAALSNL